MTHWHYALAFYWLCAGLASFQFEDYPGGEHFALRFLASLAFGGIAIPVRILAKAAR